MILSLVSMKRVVVVARVRTLLAVESTGVRVQIALQPAHKATVTKLDSS